MSTPTPARPKAENTEYGAFSRRILRAYARRIGDGDLDGLADLVALREAVDSAIDDAVAGLRAAPHAHSWAAIASRLGIGRSAAQERWAHVGGARRRGGQPYRLR